MVKKVLACLLLVVLWSSCAFGEVTLSHIHRSITDFVNGKPDYTNARFLSFWVGATNYDAQATQEDVNLTGSMTFSGGSYSFWNGRNGGMLTNSETQRTFGLASVMSIGNELEYVPHTASGDNIIFCLSADNGLNGVNVSWNFPDMPSYNGQGTIPNYRTTQEQLESYVPYVEYISLGSQVTGLRWRVVSPDNTSEAVTLDFASSLRVISVQNASGNTLYSGQWEYVEADNPVSGEVTFDSPISEADISRIRVGFYYWNNDSDNDYQWYFCKPSTPELSITENFMFNASIVNGKANYSNARFESLFFDISAGNVIAEARHFTAEGSVTIPGGGYSLMDDNTGEELGVTIPAGTDKTFKLRMHRTSAPGDTHLEYQPIYDNGANLTFSGGGENLAGRTITWTFPAELNLSGSAALSNFKSTSEQLATGAPYFEIVSRDGNITAINYKIVTSSDTSTAVTPSYRTDFRIEYYRINPDPAEGNRYRSSWINNSTSGTWTLGNPQPLSNMDYMTVRYRTWEDPNNSRQYVWNFYPAEAPTNPNQQENQQGNEQGNQQENEQGNQQENEQNNQSNNQQDNQQDNQQVGIGPGTSGGCESGLALSGVILLALFFKKR